MERNGQVSVLTASDVAGENDALEETVVSAHFCQLSSDE